MRLLTLNNKITGTMKIILLVVCFVLSNAQTIPELAEKLGAKTLVKLVTDAGLADTLSGQG